MPIKIRWNNTLLFKLLMFICSGFQFSGLEDEHKIGSDVGAEETVILPE